MRKIFLLLTASVLFSSFSKPESNNLSTGKEVAITKIIPLNIIAVEKRFA
jgi:hypothetical protein